jgi:16S rRNA (guanine(966)-N(2))-methyltransferase RsmD
VKRPGGVRILSGSLKGRLLAVPPGARPSEGRLRAALFSIWGGELAQAEIVDLFAGSGAVGIEAVSRGALGALLVEQDRRARATLASNLRAVGLGAPRIRILERPVEQALEQLARDQERFDLVFADPPYSRTPTAELVAAVAAILVPGGGFALEHSARVRAPPDGGELIRLETRRYGESALTLYRRA